MVRFLDFEIFSPELKDYTFLNTVVLLMVVTSKVTCKFNGNIHLNYKLLYSVSAS